MSDKFFGDSTIDITRRDVLKSAGAVGGGGLLFGGASKAMDSDGNLQAIDPEKYKWTANRRVVRQDMHDLTDYTGMSTTTLQLLEASWQDFGNPTSFGKGCWRYTFGVHNLGFNVINREQSDELEGTKIEPIGEVSSYLQLKSDQRHDRMAVSARRDADMFHFVPGGPFLEELKKDDGGGEFKEKYQKLFKKIIEVDDISGATNPIYIDKIRYKTEQKEDAFNELLSTVSLGLAILGSPLVAISSPILLPVVGLALSFYGAINAVISEPMKPQTPYYRGIEVGSKFSRGTVTGDPAAGYFIVFDVYADPGHQVDFTFSSENKSKVGGIFDDVDQIANFEWDINITAPQKPDGLLESNLADAYKGAKIDPDQTEFESWHSGNEVDSDPQPRIEIPDQASASPFRIEAFDTILAGGPVEEYHWTLYQVPDDVEVGDSTWNDSRKEYIVTGYDDVLTSDPWIDIDKDDLTDDKKYVIGLKTKTQTESGKIFKDFFPGKPNAPDALLEYKPVDDKVDPDELVYFYITNMNMEAEVSHWELDFDDGTTKTGSKIKKEEVKRIEHIYDTYGNYEATLTVTGKQGSTKDTVVVPIRRHEIALQFEESWDLAGEKFPLQFEESWDLSTASYPLQLEETWELEDVSFPLIHTENWESIESRSDLTVESVHADEDEGYITLGTLSTEYVVFKNEGDSTIDMTNYVCKDDAEHEYTFPDTFELDSGEKVTLHTGKGVDTATDLYWGRESSVWNNNGDTVYVYDETGLLIVRHSY